MLSACSPTMPWRVMPARSFASTAFMARSERLKPKARRNSSASPPVKPAVAMAMRRSCSWKSGTPSVRFRMGSRAGWGTVGFSRPARRRR